MAVDGLTSVLNAFQMSAGQAGHVADVMFQTVKRGKLTFPDLAANIGKVAPMARAAGMSMEDMMAAIASMTRQGLSAEESTTRLVNILKQAPRQAGDLAALIAKYAGKSLSDIQIDFPEVRAAGGIAALAADIGGFRKDLVLMQSAAGQADEAFARMTGGLSVELNKARMAVMDLMTSIGEALAPTLKAAGEWFRKAVASAGEWGKQNRGFIVSTLKVAAAMVAVGIGMMVLGTVISGLGTAFGVLATVVATVMAVLKTLATVIVFLTSPVGLIVTAVVALGAVLLHVTGAGSKALAWLGDRFKVLKEDALASFGGIADALAAGDITLAAKILWLSLKMEWTRGVNFLEKVWLNFRNFFIRIGYDAWHGLLAAVETVWHALEVGWMATVDFFASIWDGFTGFFAKTWHNIKAGAQKAWNWIRSLFDDSVDLQTENRMVEEQKQAAISRITDEQKRRAAERESERQSARQVHEGTLAEIGRENLDKHSQLDTEYAERMAANEADLARARQEWREAIDTAKRKREEKAAEGGLEGPDDILQKARDALASLGDIGDLVQAEAAKVGVRGTFNASALQGLAAGNAADRTATATEETAKNTKRLVQAAQTGGLTFA
ncbi:MAG: phage tail tape measure protein [Lentisphaerae bacterium]|nr:phage tail tape measure protein [Lentisphaerota bacterium]